MKATTAVLLCLSASADAFTSPSVFAMNTKSSTRSASAVFAQQQESNLMEDFSKMAVSTASMWAASASMASADSPDWGIFEGKSLSRKSTLAN